jgi:hypothetical protein
MKGVIEMNKITKAEKIIENGVVSGYKAVENGVVAVYKKIEGKFVDTFLSDEKASTEETNSQTPNES